MQKLVMLFVCSDPWQDADAVWATEQYDHRVSFRIQLLQAVENESGKLLYRVTSTLSVCDDCYTFRGLRHFVVCSATQ